MIKHHLFWLCTFIGISTSYGQWTNLHAPDSNYENYTAIGVSSTGKNIAMSGIRMDRVTFAITAPYTISNDFGATWKVILGNSSSFDYLFWEGDVLYCKSVTSAGVKLVKSENFGLTFSVIDSPFTSNSPCIISTPGGNWYHNLAGNIYESTDKGLTWTVASSSEVVFMDYTIADNGNIVATYSKGVGYSTDGGKNWSVASYSTNDTWTESVNSISKAANGSLIYMGKSRSRIYKSTDHGVTWQLLSVTPPANTIKLLHSGNNLLALTTTGATFICIDETQFTQLTPAETGILLNGGAMAKAGEYVFACGNSGLYRYGVGSTTGIHETNSTKLLVYPNPVMDELNIHSKLPLASYTIMDSKGAVVMEGTVLNQAISTSSLNQGIYQLILHTTHQQNQVVRFTKF